MLYKLKRFISMLVLFTVVFSGIAFTSHEAVAVSPEAINDAVSKFSDALGKFSANSAADQIGKIANFCSRLGGFTSAASGVIGILQMIGVIKDSTTQMLGQILNTVKDVQTQLDGMNKTLNQIAQDLINIQVVQEEKDRNTKATTMSTNWNNFNTNYTEKIQFYLDEYESKIRQGIEKWWNETSHDGIYVLLTKKYSDENALTYSTKKYGEGLPSTSDIKYVDIERTEETYYEWRTKIEYKLNPRTGRREPIAVRYKVTKTRVKETPVNKNDTVNTDWSIGIPSECMPNTRAVTFNVNTYHDDFKKLMVTALEKAIKDNKLASNCGASAKSEYNGSSRQAMLEKYAEHVLNTVIYKISCEVMSNNDNWVTNVITMYKQYCDNILKQDSGVNAFLIYIYKTHAFEGEVKDDIVKFLDAMIAQTGFFGQFAMTCAGQDRLQTTAQKETIQEYFVNTINSLDETKKNSIIGSDNYCYITETILKASSLEITSQFHIRKHNPYAFDGCDVGSWQVTVPALVNSVYLPIIYKQYTKLPCGTKSFGEYLHKFGVQSDTSNKTYMTNYGGAMDFAFHEGISMQAYQYIQNSDYFKWGNWYNIDVGTDSRVDQEYYLCHDKVMADLFDSSNGSQSINTMIAARAFYGEGHNIWDYDEVWAFCSGGVNTTFYVYDAKNLYRYFSKTVDIIESTACHDLNADETTNPNNPFFAFNQVALVPGVSDWMGPSYMNYSKDITDIQIEGGFHTFIEKEVEPAEFDSESGDVISDDGYTVIDTFLYTGQPIEPAVTVFCSGDIVSDDGYVVTYLNNIESNDYGVIKVKGTGKYSGTITKRFLITSSSSSPSRSSSSGGCNALGGVSLVFGLAIVIMKFRRR